jgi:nicotinate phosphoribosyltransferase
VIITSLFDTDLYKFTMQQCIWNRFPRAHAEYAFNCRSKDVDLRPYAEEIRAEIDALGELRFTEEELEYLRRIRYIKPGYVDSLRGFRLDPGAVRVFDDGTNLGIRVVGNWFQTILFEVPILAIVNEVYFRNTQPNAPEQNPSGRERLREKCARINASPVPLHILEFGTRRRYSGPWQREVVETLRRETGASFLGSSNLHLCRLLGLKPYGTMAHEFLQAGQAFTHVADAQIFALEQWAQEYRGDLGIALSDVFGMDKFFEDFDLLFSKAYDGARHDSGDPFEWGEKLIAHYEKWGIDPREKAAVFSDGLTIEKTIALAERFQGRIRTSFGIGTHLTNDFDFPALQIVLKLVRLNGRPVVKVSDTPGKTMSEDDTYLAYVRKAIGLDAG